LKKNMAKNAENKIKPDRTLDCFGLLCPMPIIRTAREMKDMKVGEVLEIVSTDQGIIEDMPAWCRQTGQEYLGLKEAGDFLKVYVRKVKE
jgi:tRNA 2-thiouridine synthesizing protein A